MKKKRKLKKGIKFILFFLVLLVIGIVCFIVSNKSIKEEKKETKKEELVIKEEEKKDIIKPELKLKGKEEVILVENSEYIETGYIATDNIDGDITSNVKIKGEIDTTKIGEQIIKYSIKDSSENETIVERKVNVIKVEEKDTDGISVLMYHYFYDDEKGETGKNSNYTAKTSFESQLQYLKDNNYYFPTMKELSMYLDEKLELPSKSVIITMDDGEASNYSIAYPLALKYKIPMIMFVVTSWTNPKDELQQTMINSGYITMQSHSHNMHMGGCAGQGHGGIMQCIDYNTGVADLKTSKEILGNSDSFAYPCGDNNDHTVKMLKEAGYTLAFTTNYGRATRGQNKLALPRIRINGGISLESFKNSL